MATEIRVLDASAILALLHDEPGWERVAAALPRAVVSAVNWAEVAGKLALAGLTEEEIRTALALGVTVIPFREREALLAGELVRLTTKHGLSLGDRACLATGLVQGAPVLTADRAWVQLRVPGLRVELIR